MKHCERAEKVGRETRLASGSLREVPGNVECPDSREPLATAFDHRIVNGMSTVAQIEEAISKLPPKDIKTLRTWINRIPAAEGSSISRQLDEAGWLSQCEVPDGISKLAENVVSISGEPLSETLKRERR